MSTSTETQINTDLSSWYYFPEIFSGEEIDKIHQLAESIEFQEAKLESGSNTQNNYRKSDIKWLTPEMKNIDWLYKKIIKLSSQANNSQWQFDIDDNLENLQYGVYKGDGGHYGWHMDVGAGLTTRRKISIVIQLSSPEEYEGGELELFTSKDISRIPKKKGFTILFPSYFMHRVTPVTKGERKSLVLWVTGPPVK